MATALQGAILSGSSGGPGDQGQDEGETGALLKDAQQGTDPHADCGTDDGELCCFVHFFYRSSVCIIIIQRVS